MSATATKQEATVETIADSVHKGVDRVADAAADAERRVRQAAADAEATVRDKGARARERSEEVVGEAAAFVERHPLASLGIAFAGGVILSNLLRR